MIDENGKQHIELTTPFGKLAAKGVRVSDLIGLLTMLGVLALVYPFYEHRLETDKTGASIAASIKESARAQRLMTCIISLPQERREQEFTQANSFCQRMSNLP